MSSENMPLVTAVIPVYNHEKYVVESIRSILNQTYRNIELIVLNDGSKDRSHEMVLTLVEECKQRFVRFEYINRENIGLSATLNQALAWARGEYFSALASDDVALPEKIEVLVDALEAKGNTYAAAFGNAWFIDDAGQRVRLDRDGLASDSACGRGCDNFLDFYTQGRGVNYNGDEFGTYASLISGNYLPAMSNVVRTKAILDVGGWTPGNIVEDWEMWLKICKKFKFVYVDRPVALYRWHETNTARTIPSGLLYSSFLLVHKEKQFCKSRNLNLLWRNAHNTLAYDLLGDGRVLFKNKLAILKMTPKLSLLRHVIKQYADELRRKAHRIRVMSS